MTTEVVEKQAVAAKKPSLDLRVLGETLGNIPRMAKDEAAALTALTRIVKQLTSSQIAMYFPTDTSGKVVEGAVVSAGQADEETQQLLWKIGSLTIGERSVQTSRCSDTSNDIIVCVPIVRPRHATESLATVISVTDPARILPGVVQILQLVAAFAAQWRGRIGEGNINEQLGLYASLTSLLAEASQKTTLEQFAQHVIGGLRDEFGLASAAFVKDRRSKMRVLAMAPAQKFDRQSELVRVMAAAAEEAKLHAESNDQIDVFSLTQLRTETSVKLASLSQAEHIDCLVIRNHDRSISGFGLLIGGSRSKAAPEALSIASNLLGHQQEVFQKAVPGLLRRIRIAYRKAFRRRWIVNIGIPAIAIALLLAAPFPLKIKTNCTVQPETKRYISAPYEGRLESVFVEPGDVVHEGDVLARMDAREIRWELGVVLADFNRARKQRDAAMAPGARDESTAQIAKFEMERLELKRKLLQEREENLDIKSPTDGVVISGDPKKLEGARLTMGQTLAEVGPMDENMFELEIADVDVRHVSVGDEVRIKLDSLPGETLHGELALIHPRAEQRGDRNVFIGDVSIAEAENLQLRPGMKGTAKIIGPKHPLGWNLFHKAWDQILFRLGW